MNLLSLTILVASRIGALIYPVVKYQPIPFNAYISWAERTITALTSSTTSAGQLARFVTRSSAGKYVLGYLNINISDKVAYTWSRRFSSTTHLEPTKSLPVYLALVFRLRLPATPTEGLCFPPTPAVEIQFESVFAIFVALLICISATSLLLLYIIGRRFNVVHLASLQEHITLDGDFAHGEKPSGDANMAPRVRAARDHCDSFQGNAVDPDFDKAPGLEFRTLKSDALKTKPKPLRNVRFSKVEQVFIIPHRLDNLWERDTIVIIPRVNLLKNPGARRSRDDSVQWSETVAVRYINPRKKVVWETQPWCDAFWNDS